MIKRTFYFVLAVALLTFGADFGFAQNQQTGNTSGENRTADHDGKLQEIEGDVELKPVANELKSGVQTEHGGPVNPRPRAGEQGSASRVRRGQKPDGKTQTVSDRQGRRTINMRQNPKEGIFVEIVMNYGPDDKAELIRNHPKLADYVELFPQQLDQSSIELNLTIRTKYRANTPEELKTKNQNAFNLFRKYYKPHQNSRRIRSR